MTVFGAAVYERIVVGAVRDLADALLVEAVRVAAAAADGSDTTRRNDVSATIHLLLAAFLRGLRAKNIAYLVDLCREQFR